MKALKHISNGISKKNIIAMVVKEVGFSIGRMAEKHAIEHKKRNEIELKTANSMNNKIILEKGKDILESDMAKDFNLEQKNKLFMDLIK